MVRRLACVTALLVAGSGATLAAALVRPVAALADSPNLRLFAAAHRTTVSRPELRAGVADLGLWVAAVGGGFQLDVRRPGYRAWKAFQVDAVTGTLLRAVPARLVDPARGLKQFLSIRFVDSRGRGAARELVTFCPSGESARIDDSGPLNPSYAGGCSVASVFPFVRGIVWGIDSGWAVAPTLGQFPGIFPGVPGPVGVLPPVVVRRLRGGVDLKPGRYRAIVSITRTYRRLFAIPAEQASVTIRVRVIPGRPAPLPRPPVVVRRAVARRVPGPWAAATAAEPDPATMPNLVALPAWGIRIRHVAGRDLLTFSATIWNSGPAPFSVEGYRRANSNLMDAFEYFFDSSGNVVGRASAGTIFYDNAPGHHHWHLRQLAEYRLIGPAARAVRSHKQSFCIAPTDPVDLTVPHAANSEAVFAGLGFGGSVCDLYSPDAIWIREQLPTGWGDTYTQSVAGQAFDITHVRNGRYRIEVRVNPLGVLSETTTADDVAIRHIRLSGRPGARRVRAAPWHGING